MLHKFFSVITWFVFLIGFAITAIVAIAQNSVPGNSTYGIKTRFEKIVLAGYRLAHKDTDYEIDLTKIRFKESQQVLKTANASESLKNLNLQILSTSVNIKNIKDTTKKTTYAKKYITTLKEMKTQLDYEKINIITSTNTSTSFSVTSNSSTSEESTLTEDIDTTRDVIEEAIEDIEEEIPEEETNTSESTYAIPTLVPTVNIEDSSMTGNALDQEPSPTPEETPTTPTPTPESKTISTPTTQPSLSPAL